MKAGEVIEEGSHEDLLTKRDAYYGMWEQQFPMITRLNGTGNAVEETVAAA
jgi:hypothetical protein